MAIVGAIMSEGLRLPVHSGKGPKKLLVCAPSNAAVDELVMRLKAGIKTLNGQERQIKLVRIGNENSMAADRKSVV